MTKIKICGITNSEDALFAVECGADALGFNFYDRSPRYISPPDAAGIIAQVPPETMTVGVFVNSDAAEMVAIRAMTGIGVVQLHGDESPEFVRDLRLRIGAQVIKAIRVSDVVDPSVASAYDGVGFLLDSDSAGFGGSGEGFDRSVAVEFKKLVPEFFLAGGLTPENVADAIRIVRPYGVDVCSGVESVKGKKDRARVETFIANARMAL